MIKGLVLLPENCRKAPSCIDYRAYIFSVPKEQEPLDYQQVQTRLIEMGRLRHEMLGVSYVDTEWGLMVIPPMGYNEIKVNFFHHITTKMIEQVLADITKVLSNTE